MATRIALVAYLIPYSFIYNPVILLENFSWVPLAIIVVASLASIFSLASALQGWMFERLSYPVRVVLFVAAIVAFLPDYRVKAMAALFIGASVIALKILNARRTVTAS